MIELLPLFQIMPHLLCLAVYSMAGHQYAQSVFRLFAPTSVQVGIFFLGAGASVIHGLHTLMEVRVLGGEMWSYAGRGKSQS